jgi:ADP-ribose pyrophosphatase YjhB (NUDIX family)
MRARGLFPPPRCVFASRCPLLSLPLAPRASGSRRFWSPPAFAPLGLRAGPHSSLVLDLRPASLAGTPCAAIASLLAEGLPHWRAAGLNTVWVHVELPSRAALLAAATSPPLGFSLHHARGRSLTLFKWLPEGTPCKVPPFGGTQVGVGGVCVDGAGRVLLVRERLAPAAAWKFPGGLGDPGEDMGDTAVREVFEETGVRTTFAGLLALRQQHGIAFGASDIYAMALLRLAPGADAARITVDPSEIAEAKWESGEAFAEATSHPMMKLATRAALRVAGGAPGAPLMHCAPFFSHVLKKWTHVFSVEPFSPPVPPPGAPPPPAPAAPWAAGQ